MSDAQAFGRRIESLDPAGLLPSLRHGRNRLRLGWTVEGAVAPRIGVTVMPVGPELRGPDLPRR